MFTRIKWIKKRAYALWEKEGYPTGRDFHHWEQATKEHDALKNSAASVDGREIKAKVIRKPRVAAAATAKTATSAAPKKTTRKVASK